MKIKLEIPKEELSTLINGVNNAYILLVQTYQALLFGCEVGEPFCQFSNFSPEEIENKFKPRIVALLGLYEQLIKYEKGLDKPNKV